jgi:hypothetical protein
MQVDFQPLQVRSFRQIATRSISPTERDGAATHSVWFEIMTNGKPTASAKVLGQMTLPGIKFTTATMAPFESTTLQIVDRGNTWQAATDDFAYEAALVGFGLLGQGKNLPPALNYQRVLELAEAAQAVSDRTRERGRFIASLKASQRQAGLAP